ncbi:flagellar hook-length control protein FliK [Clostridium septicum]|uniref:Flagellar hook-length control protein FliK n=1 Tax=Clostridium septicum TaxID=1504 RepID=A0A9N7JKB2_CLOSE|nr:flagellar hook-length control protein FliK [Clostridium septicum]AYE33427.1 flagellar hook-length control protein FliK [Clostridium septicum]MDU1313963.1 flagellar hook-length control protein FliK [Clostridium septicum]QAS61601.1 flagellar hook-length control protein FliK [Clostridium septicum]UEC21963.1 flagellar hook-length control protein FliK [Clostridium septicum]USS00006.1 flagellar hook-length control protein FliK [Clostridium septicum]
MIDTNAFINFKTNEVDVKKISTRKDSFSRKRDFKETLNNEVGTKLKSNVNLDNNKEPIKNEVVTVKETTKKIEKAFEELKDFQGNKEDTDCLENITLLLGELMQSKEFQDVTLDNPEIKDEINLILKDILKSDENSVLGKDVLRLDLEEFRSKQDILNEAVNLTNNILEMINSNDFKKVLSDEDSKKLNAILEMLNEKLFSEDANNLNLANEIKNEENSIISKKHLKDFDSKLEKSDEEVNSVNNKSQNNTSINKFNKSDLEKEASKDNANFGETLKKEVIDSKSNSKSLSKEDKILSKILNDDKNLGLNKLLNNRFSLNDLEIIKEPAVVNKQTMDLDIIKNVKFMVKNAMSELKVKIYPKELGEMTIKILSEEGIMKAEIKATSKETYNLLNSNINDIKKGLEQQNIKIHDVNIGLYQEDATFYNGENFSNSQNQNKSKRSKSNLSEITSLDSVQDDEIVKDDNNVNLLA